MSLALRVYLLHAVAIFLSAFLLFQIQPIAAKHLLPYFGGASGVWASSLLFFTTLLFVGYAYVYFLTRLPQRKQVLIHRVIIALSAVVVPGALISWKTIYPPLEWATVSSFPPYLLTLLALLASVGVPYFLLSTSGPLIQFWYGISHAKEPYKLYALSNAGSLLALMSYPFLVEPFVRLKSQEFVWGIAFLAFAALFFVVSARFARASLSHDVSEMSPVGFVRILAWVGLAAFPSLLLVATTTQITQVIAPVPLLWIVPLSLYLLTFIVAFTGFRLKFVLPVLSIASAGTAYYFLDYTFEYMPFKIAAYLAFLFFVGLHCHSELYRLRPSTQQSAFFYVFVSLGGMLGALIASIGAPLLLNDYWEFPLAIAIAAIFGVYALADSLVRTRVPAVLAYTLAYGGLFAIGLTASYYVRDIDTDYVVKSRNFYGTAYVDETVEKRSLYNGTTLHGMQSREAGKEGEPTTYYVAMSGVGRSIAYAHSKHKKGIRVGTIGLGAGVIAGHCKDGDTFTFYDIDARIEQIARTYFSFLERCDGSEVRIGDGRVLLDRELRESGSNQYDVIVLDAFADDSIPMHLLTIESIRTYVAHLRDKDAILAIHISNRYLDLLPVVMRAAQEDGLSLLAVNYAGDDDPLSSSSSWVLLSPGQNTFAAPSFTDAASALSDTKVDLWTDDHTDILSILDLPI